MAVAINPYRPLSARVLEVRAETPSIKTFRLEPAEPLTFAPGQFIEVTVTGVGEAPFTPSSSASDRKTLEVTIMRVGRVTERLHALQPGDRVGVRGPLGNGYPLEDFDGREVVVIGGGCGFAPLRSLMYAFFERSDRLARLVFRGGCRNDRELLFREELDAWTARSDVDVRLTVDEASPDWPGHVGVVTTILDDLPVQAAEARAVVCGPPLMMRFAVKKLAALGFQDRHIYLSLEENMSCGIGLCGHCRIGPWYICRDGPVFTCDQIRKIPGMAI